MPEADEAAGGLADGLLRPVDPRSIRVDRIVLWILAVALSVAAIGAVSLAWLLGVLGPTLGAGLLAAAVAAGGALGHLAQVLPDLVYERTRYRVTPVGIEIRKGVWWRHVIDVPRSRIQHTDVTEGPLMRRFGLAALVVHTAGTEHASVRLEGLARDRALAIRDFLIRGETRDGV